MNEIPKQVRDDADDGFSSNGDPDKFGMILVRVLVPTEILTSSGGVCGLVSVFSGALDTSAPSS